MVNGALTMPCARMPGMSSPTPTRKPLLPPAALKWLGVAFAIGLLLFLMLWLDQRNDTDFFKGGPASESGEPANLPAPLPPDLAGSDDNASGLRLPRDGDGSALPPPSRSALANQFVRQVSEIPKSAATCFKVTPSLSMAKLKSPLVAK